LLRTSRSILVVDADLSTLFTTAMLLREAGHRTATVSTFEDAKRLLTTMSPDVLITDVRLGAFNGLHLALRRHLQQPDSASIITSATADRMLEAEACAIDVPYLLKPVASVELLAVIDRMLERDRSARLAFRRSPRRRIAGGVGATLEDTPVVVLDVSDAGLCLEIEETAKQAVGSSFRITLQAFGLSVSADSIWTKRDTDSGALKCGAALLSTDRETMQAWLGFVDSLG
jgi:DNA-binding response OmpR family regulator